MKKAWKILFAIVISFVVLVGIFWGYLLYGLQETLNLTIGPVDLSTTPDGVYQGKYSKGRFSYQVEVTVKDHAITDVKLVAVPRISVPTVHEEIVRRVKEKGSLAVDTVTSATVSSKAILKAIENALKR